MNTKKRLVAVAALCASLSASAAAGGGLIVKSGDAVAFLGDSITRLGESKPDGYVHLVERALQYEGVAIRRRPSGRCAASRRSTSSRTRTTSARTTSEGEPPRRTAAILL